MSNALGHVVTVTNRGLHTTCSVNAQQNRLTPDWPDTVTRELPGEAVYLYDPDAGEWYSPTYHPLNDPRAAHEAEFGVDGTATFRMSRGDVETELTVYVPLDDCAVVVVLGQADDRGRAGAVVRKYRTPDAARAALAGTRRWWLGLMDTLRVRTASAAFDGYLDWLKYQALAERLWARRGFY